MQAGHLRKYPPHGEVDLWRRCCGKGIGVHIAVLKQHAEHIQNRPATQINEQQVISVYIIISYNSGFTIANLGSP
jgi:hypothetical protein